MQALKESSPERTPTLRSDLLALLTAFRPCKAYCAEKKLSYPLGRAERQVRDTLELFFPEAAAAQASAIDESQRIHVELPSDDAVEKFTLGDRQLPRLFNGFWQLSSPAFGVGRSDQQQQSLVRLVQKGLVAADMADHYVRNQLPFSTNDIEIMTPLYDHA